MSNLNTQLRIWGKNNNFERKKTVQLWKRNRRAVIKARHPTWRGFQLIIGGQTDWDFFTLLQKKNHLIFAHQLRICPVSLAFNVCQDNDQFERTDSERFVSDMGFSYHLFRWLNKSLFLRRMIFFYAKRLFNVYFDVVRVAESFKIKYAFNYLVTSVTWSLAERTKKPM